MGKITWTEMPDNCHEARELDLKEDWNNNMNDFEMLSLAKKIATKAHKGQTRWDGTPYITHPEAVANSLHTLRLKIVAWLHDVLEDTDISSDELISYGFPNHIVTNVEAVTRNNTESYAEFIDRILSSSTIAIKVKKADIKHNLQNLKKGSMRDKYELAIMLLNNELDSRNEN